MAELWVTQGFSVDASSRANMQTALEELCEMTVFKEIVKEKQLGFTGMKY